MNQTIFRTFFLPSLQSINICAFYSRTKLVDGTEVIQEVHAKPKTAFANPGQVPAGLFGNFDEVNGNKPGFEGPASGHVSWISAMTLCQSQRWYLITGSKDGVIKLWK